MCSNSSSQFNRHFCILRFGRRMQNRFEKRVLIWGKHCFNLTDWATPCLSWTVSQCWLVLHFLNFFEKAFNVLEARLILSKNSACALLGSGWYHGASSYTGYAPKYRIFDMQSRNSVSSSPQVWPERKDNLPRPEERLLGLLLWLPLQDQGSEWWHSLC